MRRSTLAGFALLAAACSSGGQPTPAPAPAASGATGAVVTACATAVGTEVPIQMRAGEDPRVSLEAGCAYLATLDVSGVVLRLYPRTSRVSNPTVSQVSTEGEAGSTWEVRNTYDGSYGIKFTNVTRGRAVVMKMVVAGSDTVTLN